MKLLAAIFLAAALVTAPALADRRVASAAELTRAIAQAKKGETITLAAGIYDVADLKLPRDVTLVGDGAVTLTSSASVAKGLLNPLSGASVRIEHIRFEGAHSPDSNGAGLRHDGADLTLIDCVFDGNENGVLATGAQSGRIVIRDSAFIANGKGDGYSHGIYVVRAARLDISGARFTGTRIGHHVKSLADETVIADSDFDDSDGRTSYAVDASKGGAVSITGNNFLKASTADNSALFNYDLTRGGKAVSLVIENNRIVNRYRRAQMLRNPTALAPVIGGNVIVNEGGAAMTVADNQPAADQPAPRDQPPVIRQSVRDSLPAALRGAPLALEAPSPRSAQKSGTVTAPTPPQTAALAHLRLTNNWSEQAATPVTVGVVFPAGAVKPGDAIAARQGAARLPVQIDVKALHEDGSVRHAAVTFEPLPLGAGETADVDIVAATAASADALDPRAIIDSNYDFPVAITFHYEDGDETVSVNAREMLLDAIENGAAPDWLNGSYASEYRLRWQAHEHLAVIFDIRTYRSGAIRTSVAFDDSKTFAPGLRHHLYDVAVGAKSKPAFFAENTAQHRSSRWRRVFWTGAPPRIFAAQASADLINAGAILPLDFAIGVDAAMIAEADAALRNPPPLSPAQVAQYFPQAGGRPDIGLYPDWTSHYLLAQSEPAARVMFAAAEAGAAVPWHFTDEKTGAPVSIEDHPKFWADERGLEDQYKPDRPHDDVFASPDGGWTADHAHKPDLFFVPYLLTADRFYADELAMQAAWAIFGRWPELREGGVKAVDVEQVRASAWSLRDIANAAWGLPARHPSKPYLMRALATNLRLMREKYADRRVMKTAGALEGYFEEYVDGDPERITPWMNDYMALSLWLAARRGAGDAARIMAWSENFQARRYLDPDFPSAYASAYRYPAKDAQTQQAVGGWAALAARISANPDPAPDLAGFPELAYSFAASGEAALAALASQSGSPLSLEALAAALARGRNDARWEHYAQGGARRHNNFLFMLTNIAGGRYGRDALRFGKDGGDDDDFIIGGDGGDRLKGGAGNDYLIGRAGVDALDGGDGDDYLSAGRDGGVLIGGPGRDVFLVSPFASGDTHIADFNPAEDRLLVQLGAGAPASAWRDGEGGAVLALSGAVLYLDGVRAADAARAVTVSH